MKAITDTNDNPLTIVQLTLAENEASAIIVCRVPCQSGTFLTAADSAFAQVLARRTGSGDAFVDLFDFPLALTPFDDQAIDFDLKVQAGEVSGLARIALPVKVSYNP